MSVQYPLLRAYCMPGCAYVCVHVHACAYLVMCVCMFVCMGRAEGETTIHRSCFNGMYQAVRKI